MIKRLLISVVALFIVISCFAQSKSEQQVRLAVDVLHQAMINADSSALAKMTSPLLVYVHSGGAVDYRTTFIEKIVSGKSDFVNISITEQFITISKKTAVVRFVMDATTNDIGKPGTVHLRIMQVWQKKGKQWKLLARQAVKPA